MHLEIALDDARMQKVLAEAPKRGAEAWKAAHFLWAQDLLDIAEPLTPFRRGRLWGSRVATRSDPVEVAMTAEHAIPVHERNALHARGQWKYLEIAMQRLRARGTSSLARYFETAFKRGDTLASVPARHPERARS